MKTVSEDQLFEIIGKNIKKLRTSSGVNQTYLASSVGLSRTSVVNIEQGKQHASLYVLWKIAESLGVELHDLLPTRTQLINAEFVMKVGSSVKKTLSEDNLDRINRFWDIVNNK